MRLRSTVWKHAPGRKGKFVNNGRNSRMRAGWPFTIRERLRPLLTWRHAAVLIAAILVFAWLGPFGTGTRFAPPELLLYWTLAIGLNWVLGVFVFVIPSLLSRPGEETQWSGLVIGALIAALPGTGLIFLLESWLAEPLRLAAELVYVYASVALIHVVIGYLAGELIGRRAGASASEPEAAKPGKAAFLARLSPELGDNLLHLRMQDHYVEVITDKGSELLLMRFGDAMQQVEDLDGVRVHRSHWVATPAVRKIRREHGRAILELSNGEEVPVSRSFKAALARFDRA